VRESVVCNGDGWRESCSKSKDKAHEESQVAILKEKRRALKVRKILAVNSQFTSTLALGVYMCNIYSC